MDGRECVGEEWVGPTLVSYLCRTKAAEVGVAAAAVVVGIVGLATVGVGSTTGGGEESLTRGL